MATHATGKYASSQCPVCSDVVAYLSMRKRWDGQWVCSACLEPRHPAERRRVFKDAISLHRPRKDNSSNDGTPGFGLRAISHDAIGKFTVSIT